jgi:hypothetical protein
MLDLSISESANNLKKSIASPVYWFLNAKVIQYMVVKGSVIVYIDALNCLDYYSSSTMLVVYNEIMLCFVLVLFFYLY